jgi:hypothetical protein
MAGLREQLGVRLPRQQDERGRVSAPGPRGRLAPAALDNDALLRWWPGIRSEAAPDHARYRLRRLCLAERYRSDRPGEAVAVP